MRLDPFGLTGPPTSKKWKREKKKRQLLRSSSSSLSASFVERVRFVRAASSRSFSGSTRDRVLGNDSVFAARYCDEARHRDGPDNEEAGIATAFRVPRDSASRGVVHARTRDCHEDHEDENDYDGDTDVGVVLAGAPLARTRILRVDRSSLQRRVPRSARRARGTARRRREGGPIPEERPDVAASAVSFVNVLAYTAYSDDRDDDNGDDEERVRFERKRIHGGPEGDRDEHTENRNDNDDDDDDDDDARVSVSSNEQKRRDAKENASREDYICAEVDAINHGVPKSDHQWASPSSSLERIDNYGCEHPTVDEEFDRHGRREENRWRRSDNTAWFQKPITRRRGGGTGEKPRTRRSYYKLLLFMLYLLAWPLLCSTSPSAHFTSTFTQNPTLAHTKNPAQRGNASPPDASYSSSTVTMQHQHQQSQQYVQGSDYNTDNERYRHHQPQQQQQQQQPGRKKKREQSNREEEPQSALPDKTIYTWEVNQLNPWLSACDLAGPAPADLQGSCGPPEVPKYCPMQCKDEKDMIKRAGISGARTKTTTTTTRTGVEDGVGKEKKKEEGVRTAREQCLLYLEESHKEKICGDDSGRSTSNLSLNDRYQFVSKLRLRHCCEQAVVNALAPGKDGLLEVLNGSRKCADTLDKLLIVDALAARLHCEFEEVLARYDCAQPYSVIHNCTHCKEAYRKWVCSSLVPYFAHVKLTDAETPGGRDGPRLRPCRSFCQFVEQRCPYLLPGDRAPAYPTQYAGEPTFLCRDPNIPETGEQAARALHNSDDSECCFEVCAEDEPMMGICTNCEEPWKHGRLYDPWSAPQCDTAFQSDPTDQYPGSQAGQPEADTDRGPADDSQETSTASSSSNTPVSSSTTTTDKQNTLFCGSGRIGSIPSASSPGQSSPSIVLQLFWLCSILISLPANALQYNLAPSWSPFGFLRLIGSGLPGVFVLRRTFNDLRASTFGPRSAGIYRHAVVRCLLFILWMPRRAVTKCRRRGWWWWRSWRRSSSRHFRWKLPRHVVPGDVAPWRSVLRDASTAVFVLFLKFTAKCRCRDWWWLWRRWRKCGSMDGQDARLVRRKRSTMIRGKRRRGRRRGRGPSGIFKTDVASSAKATSRKDPP